jgi:hypothetical protein
MRTKTSPAWLGAGLSVLLVAGGLSLTPGCASRPLASVNAGVEVPGDPPPLVAESVPPSPGMGYYWIGGSWVWYNHWAWEPGRWELPPHPGAVWIPDRYVYQNGRHVFIRGGWR